MTKLRVQSLRPAMLVWSTWVAFKLKRLKLALSRKPRLEKKKIANALFQQRESSTGGSQMVCMMQLGNIERISYSIASSCMMVIYLHKDAYFKISYVAEKV